MSKRTEIAWLNHELEFERKSKRMAIDACNKALDIKDKEVKRIKDEIENLKAGINWRDRDIKDFEDEIDKKNEEIDLLKCEIEGQRETIKRMSQQLTEHELFEKKIKELNNNGGITNAEVVKRMCRLEAKYEAQENPYFF